jgi:two-component system, OmpR family, sensor histidine kinase KdpD
MSDENRAEWTVVHVETPGEMNGPAESRNNVARHLRLAEMLGAHTEILTGRTVKETIREYAQDHHYRQLMIGRSTGRRVFNMFGVSLAEQLIRDDPTISIYIVGSDHTARPFQIPRFWSILSWMHLLGAVLLAAVPTLLGRLLTPNIISRSSNLIMLYLLVVIAASIFLGLVPALLTALLSVILYDFFFVPPIYSLIGIAPENLITFGGLLLISGIISTLVTRERTLTRAAQRRTDQVTQLYELSRNLAIAVDMPDILQTIVDHVQQTLEREVVILLPKNGELILSASSSGQALDPSELTAAEWAFQQGRPAGNNTGTFSYASYRYLPLQTSRRILGVIGVRLEGITPDLHPEQMRMLGAFTTNASSAVERAMLAEDASQTEILRATEKLQTALLNSISHDLRTPLATITGGLSSLRMEEDFLDPETRRELVETALGEAERLNRLVGNLLDMTRLESGSMRISLQPCDIQDVIGSALNTLTARLEGHPVEVEIPADLPLVPLDYVLIDQVMINLLDNAVKYSPENSPIEIRAGVAGEMMQVSVEDHGPGIPEEDLERIFEKFYRVKRFENVVGTGLGLSICKGIVEVHGGKIWAENRQAGGVRIIFSVPLQPLSHLSQETEVPRETEISQ